MENEILTVCLMLFGFLVIFHHLHMNLRLLGTGQEELLLQIKTIKHDNGLHSFKDIAIKTTSSLKASFGAPFIFAKSYVNVSYIY